MKFMKTDYCKPNTGFYPKPYIANIPQMARQNPNFRVTVWTGYHSQMTLMCIPACSDIGVEIHKDTDQIIRIEQGMATVKMGVCENQLNTQRKVYMGDTIFIPAGIWHNIINIQNTPLKLSSIYSPAHHPIDTLQPTKEDAEKEHS